VDRPPRSRYPSARDPLSFCGEAFLQKKKTRGISSISLRSPEIPGAHPKPNRCKPLSRLVYAGPTVYTPCDGAPQRTVHLISPIVFIQRPPLCGPRRVALRARHHYGSRRPGVVANPAAVLQRLSHRVLLTANVRSRQYALAAGVRSRSFWLYQALRLPFPDVFGVATLADPGMAGRG